MSEVDRIFEVVEWAKGELDKLDLSIYGAKKRVVQEAAVKLEGIIQTDSIAEELAHQLKDKISKNVVYSALDDKYKNKKRSEAAKLSANSHREKQPKTNEEITITNEGRAIPNPDRINAQSRSSNQSAFEVQDKLRLDALEHEVKELHNLLKPFSFEYTVQIKGQSLPLIIHVNVQGRDGRVSINEEKARRMYA